MGTEAFARRHHPFSHPDRGGVVTVPHPRKQLDKGLVQAMRRQAGLGK